MDSAIGLHRVCVFWAPVELFATLAGCCVYMFMFICSSICTSCNKIQILALCLHWEKSLPHTPSYWSCRKVNTALPFQLFCWVEVLRCNKLEEARLDVKKIAELEDLRKSFLRAFNKFMRRLVYMSSRTAFHNIGTRSQGLSRKSAQFYPECASSCREFNHSCSSYSS